MTLSAIYEPSDIVIYYNNLYFIDNEMDNLYRMPKDGSSEPEAVAILNSNQWNSPDGLHIEFCKS